LSSWGSIRCANGHGQITKRTRHHVEENRRAYQRGAIFHIDLAKHHQYLPSSRKVLNASTDKVEPPVPCKVKHSPSIGKDHVGRDLLAPLDLSEFHLSNALL
jgi:hypothetical protein